MARLLHGAAVVLALLFVLRVLFSLAPLRSGAPLLLLRFCEGMVSAAPLATLAVCLIGLSLLIDDASRGHRRLARGLRGAALPMVWAYLLSIPLYGAAQWWRARAEASALRQGLQFSLQQLGRTRRSVQQASCSEQLQRIWSDLPAGSPPLTRFGATASQQRTALVYWFDQASGSQRTRLNGVEPRLMTVVVRNTGIHALACLGLAALFYRSSQLVLPSRQRWRLAFSAATDRQGNEQPAPREAELEHPLEDRLDAAAAGTGSIAGVDGLEIAVGSAADPAGDLPSDPASPPGPPV